MHSVDLYMRFIKHTNRLRLFFKLISSVAIVTTCLFAGKLNEAQYITIPFIMLHHNTHPCGAPFWIHYTGQAAVSRDDKIPAKSQSSY
jgi:hypothetical protein